ncbi:hypothetical protein HDF16_004145 [Granulicella aggregans]|uniref:Uncharacterized protein n=1 Tax=Granulicella aggregans TaxID=474949 RepID=A0A7W8E5L2_9BACT|nr:hypothetical protein [Granulicella aggregans]MBB5059419.1 hypothetical protein [Granulicella aggregans]
MFATPLIVTALLFAAQTPALPANYIHVDAPAAQRMIVAEKNKHSEIGKLGLHATPPAATDNVIIASDNPTKIGKKSSAPDMEHLATGKPFVVRIEKEKIFDLLLPITDSKGGDLNGGFVVMEVPFDKATDEEQALKIGIAIRDELQSEISSKAALYQR